MSSNHLLFPLSFFSASLGFLPQGSEENSGSVLSSLPPPPKNFLNGTFDFPCFDSRFWRSFYLLSSRSERGQRLRVPSPPPFQQAKFFVPLIGPFFSSQLAPAYSPPSPAPAFCLAPWSSYFCFYLKYPCCLRHPKIFSLLPK